jgi:hypothetical protein
MPIFVAMKKSSLFLLFFISFLYAKNGIAQTTAENVLAPDTALAHIIIIKDARLDLLDGRPEALRLAALASAKAKEVKIQDKVNVYDPIKAGNKTVTGSITQVQGFRVMIYNGPDRVLAMKIKSEFNKRYPTMRSYMSYNVPNFKIKVGDFADRKDANKFLKMVQLIVPAAVVMPDVVTVKNIIIQ